MSPRTTPTEITTTNTTKISNRKGLGAESRLDSALDEMCSSIGHDMGGRRHLPTGESLAKPRGKGQVTLMARVNCGICETVGTELADFVFF
jgi:hypothetical protein